MDINFLGQANKGPQVIKYNRNKYSCNTILLGQKTNNAYFFFIFFKKENKNLTRGKWGTHQWIWVDIRVWSPLCPIAQSV